MIPSIFGGQGRGALDAEFDFNFLKCEIAVDTRLTTSGGAGAVRGNSSGSEVSKTCPRLEFDQTTLAAKGLLIEEQRLQGYRNGSASGAVAGSPGTMPTNWGSNTSLTGLTRTVVGSGTENGIPYVDVTVSGTPSAAGAYDFSFEGAAVISAAFGQTWTTSLYLRLTGGNWTGVSSMFVRVNELNSAPTQIAGQNTSAFTNPTGAALNTQKQWKAYTLTGATTAWLSATLRLNLTGAAVNFTLRIGYPKTEQGAFPTSDIPSTSAQVTRTADSVTLVGSALATASGTYLIEFTTGAGLVSNGVYWGLSASGDANNTVWLWNSGGTLSLSVKTGGIVQANLPLGALAANTTYKVGISLEANEVAARVNGGAEQLDTSVTLPATVDMGVGRAPWGNFSHSCIWQRRIQKWTRTRRSELATLTT